VELNGNVHEYGPVKSFAEVVPSKPVAPAPTPMPEWAKGAIPGGIPVAAAGLAQANVAASNSLNAPANAPATQSQPVQLSQSVQVIQLTPAQAETNSNAQAVADVPLQPAVQVLQGSDRVESASVTSNETQNAKPSAVTIGEPAGAMKAMASMRSGSQPAARVTFTSSIEWLMTQHPLLLNLLAMLGMICISGSVVLFVRKWRRLR